MIGEDTIKSILDACDIYEIASEVTRLKRSGKEYVGLCPLHEEKTPSFRVNREKGVFHCFGCGASGSAIGLVMSIRGVGFQDAVRMLAERYGLSHLLDSEKKGDGAASKLIEVNDAAADLYRKWFWGRKGGAARRYLFEDRGLDRRVVERFGIGYAPFDEAIGKYLDVELSRSAGLVDASGRDVFRGRIVFPIRDERGRTLGFGGRILPGGNGPKYLNTRQTAVFNKKRSLYGLYEWRPIGDDYALLVEGYMDVISLHRHGITCACAVLGTAPQRGHIRALFGRSNRIAICFDNDAAGRKATWAAVQAGLSELFGGREILVVDLPPGEDPASILSSSGMTGWRTHFDKAKKVSEIILEKAAEGIAPSASTEEGALFLKRLRKIIAPIPNEDFKNLLKTRAEKMLGVPVSFDERKSSETPTFEAARIPEIRLAALLCRDGSALWNEIGETNRTRILNGEYGELVALCGHAVTTGADPFDAIPDDNVRAFVRGLYDLIEKSEISGIFLLLERKRMRKKLMVGKR